MAIKWRAEGRRRHVRSCLEELIVSESAVGSDTVDPGGASADGEAGLGSCFVRLTSGCEGIDGLDPQTGYIVVVYTRFRMSECKRSFRPETRGVDDKTGGGNRPDGGRERMR